MARILAILLIVSLAVAGFLLYSEEEPECRVCDRPMHEATRVSLTLRNGEVIRVCCPRCGLHFQAGRDDVVRSAVADFNTGKVILAGDATYVEGSSVHLCCSHETVREDRSGVQYQLDWDRCLPSVIAFQDMQSARDFADSFGGSVTTYQQLLDESSRAH